MARLLLLLALLVSFSSAHAAIVINEVLPNPPGGVEDNIEWVEIYNTGPDTVNVTGWAIEDLATIDDGNIRRPIPEAFDAAFGLDPVMLPGEFRVVQGVGPAYINNGGDTIYLNSDRTGNLASVVHSTSYGTAPEGDCWANLPDGTDPANFAWRLCTKGVSNCASDATAPAAITTLAAVAGAFAGEVDLTWNCVGDDSITGTAVLQVVKYNTVPITLGNFDSSLDAFNEPLPAVPGTAQGLTIFNLTQGQTYYFSIKTLDCQNTSGLSNVPSTQAGTTALPFVDQTVGLQPYYGNMHSHTSYSDGVSTPAAAYNYARNLAPTPLDFLAVSDHNHAFTGITPALYAQGLAEAATATVDGSFIAIYGQEWGLSTGGHTNVYESPVLFGWDAGNFDVFVAEGDYTGLYAAVINNPSPWGPLMSFNHPGSGDFNNYSFTNDGGVAECGIALVNGPAFSAVTDESDVGNTNFDDKYQFALSKGFFISPYGDQDNHEATWGSSSQSRTAVLLTSLTKANLMAGFAARRTYATQDHNAEVTMKVNGWPMGARFDVNVGEGVNFDVSTFDSDGEGVTLYELFRGSPGVPATLIATADNVDHFVHRDTESPTPAQGAVRVYYVRITQNDNQRLWTAPVQITFNTNVDVAENEQIVPRTARLLPAYPNPFNPRTRVSFETSREGHVSLQVYDIAGRLVRTLSQGQRAAGLHSETWDGTNGQGWAMASGVYMLSLRVEGAPAQSSRIVLLK